MSVHIQHPSKSFLFDSIKQELIGEMDYTQQPHFFLSSNQNNGFETNQKKRSRDLYPSSSSNAALFQMMPTPKNTNQLVSTNLHLSYENKNIEEDLNSIINQQAVELDQYLTAQGDKLRRKLAETQATHCRALMKAAEESSLKQIRAMDLEIDRAGKRKAELETRLARTGNELLTWQARALSEHEKATSLQAQIQQAQLAAVRKTPGRSEPEAEDRCSVYEDPARVEVRISDRSCRVCAVSDVSVVLLPCRHLCICESCNGAFGTMGIACCPVCNVVTTGSIQVLFS